MNHKTTFEEHFNRMRFDQKVRFANRMIWNYDLDLALLRGSWTEVPKWLLHERDAWIERRDVMVWEGVDITLERR